MTPRTLLFIFDINACFQWAIGEKYMDLGISLLFLNPFMISNSTVFCVSMKFVLFWKLWQLIKWKHIYGLNWIICQKFDRTVFVCFLNQNKLGDKNFVSWSWKSLVIVITEYQPHACTLELVLYLITPKDQKTIWKNS